MEAVAGFFDPARPVACFEGISAVAFFGRGGVSLRAARKASRPQPGPSKPESLPSHGRGRSASRLWRGDVSICPAGFGLYEI